MPKQFHHDNKYEEKGFDFHKTLQKAGVKSAKTNSIKSIL